MQALCPLRSLLRLNTKRVETLAKASKWIGNITDKGKLYKGPSMSQFLTGSKRDGKQQSLVIIGHRGSGKNVVVSTAEELPIRDSVMENTIKSLIQAVENGVDFVEFDVQITKDGHAVIFHDDYIVEENNGSHCYWRIGDITLDEYLSFGFQTDGLEIQRPLVRKTKEGNMSRWIVHVEDRLCTLKHAFEQIPLSVGFDIELKFDDKAEVPLEILERSIDVVLKEAAAYGKGRKIFFTSFHPEAVHCLRSMQDMHPVLFLTEGGTCFFKDERRNSVEAAIDACLQSGLQGLVIEAAAILNSPFRVSKVKDTGLCLLTYGDLNNDVQALQTQAQYGVDGVIVDNVLEIVGGLHFSTSKDGLAS